MQGTAALLLLLTLILVSMSAYGISSLDEFHTQADRIRQQHNTGREYDRRQREALRDADTLRAAIADLPDVAGNALTSHDRNLIREDIQAVAIASHPTKTPVLANAAAPCGLRVGGWHDSTEITAHRAAANVLALHKQHQRIAAIIATTQTLDGAIAHTGVSIRVHLADTLQALPSASRASVRAAAVATPGDSPVDRAHRLWDFVNSVHAATQVH